MILELDPEKKPTLTIEEAAVVLGVARSTAYAAARDGDIPTIRIGKRILVPTSAIRSLLQMDA